MSVLAAQAREEIVPVAGGRLNLRVQVLGSGPPVVYLHPAGGFDWDPFLEQLAGERTVYAPLVPGTSSSDPDAIDEVRDLWELVLAEQEALLALGLAGADVIGASFGGMLACELQATFPGMFGRLVLLDPIGLWRDDAPVVNWLIAAPADLPKLLFVDPDAPAVQARFAPPADPGAAATPSPREPGRWAAPPSSSGRSPIAAFRGGFTASRRRLWSSGGSATRSCRSPTREEFGRRIPHARVEIIEGCGHVPQVERCEQTLALVRGFLALSGSA